VEVGARSGVFHVTNSDTPTLPAGFYDMMYQAIHRGVKMGSCVDRKLALMLREVCQSDCSEVGRNAVADTLDMYLGRIRPDVTVDLATSQFLKWNLTIVSRADKEESRMSEAWSPAPKDRRRDVGKSAAYKVGDKRPRPPFAFTLVLSKSSGKIDLPAERPSYRNTISSDIDEITRMMARWHL
jgi:hypothetical protein